MTKRNSIALIIPCLNEEIAIAKVIDDFRSIISHLDIYVIDNGKIVDSGKHDELLDKSKIYKNFYQSQIKHN